MKKTMMNNIFKRFAALALCTGMVTGTALAANAVYKNIRVQYCGIKLVVDGQTVIPKDANGKVVEPFIYNGTTYLPVRAVGNAVDKKVKWDGNSKTVYLGTTPDESGEVYLEPYQTSAMKVYKPENGKSFSMMGVPYSRGVMVYNFYNDTEMTALYNLNAEYDSVSMDIGHVDNSGSDSATMNVYVDDKLIDTIALTSDMSTKNVKFDLNHGLQLKIQVIHCDPYAHYGLVNIKFAK